MTTPRRDRNLDRLCRKWTGRDYDGTREHLEELHAAQMAALNSIRLYIARIAAGAQK